MKSKLIILMTALVLVFSNCSKIEMENTPQLNQPSLAVKSEKNVSTQLLMYSSLTTQEQETLWLAHLNYCLSTYTLTTEQITKINEGITLINNGLFSGVNVNQYDIWVVATTDVFPSVKKRYMVFGTLTEYTDSEFTNPHPTPMVPNGAGSDGCGCSDAQYNDFCGTNNFYVIGVGSYQYRCEDPSCDATSGGCGWFWLKSCSGDCKQFFVPSGGHD
jgi:hypothetical protein